MPARGLGPRNEGATVTPRAKTQNQPLKAVWLRIFRPEGILRRCLHEASALGTRLREGGEAPAHHRLREPVVADDARGRVSAQVVMQGHAHGQPPPLERSVQIRLACAQRVPEAAELGLRRLCLRLRRGSAR